MSANLVLITNSVSVTTSDTLLSAAKIRRGSIVIENTGTTNLHVRFGTAAATAANGHLIAADARLTFEHPGEGEIRAISITSTNVVLVTEEE